MAQPGGARGVAPPRRPGQRVRGQERRLPATRAERIRPPPRSNSRRCCATDRSGTSGSARRTSHRPRPGRRRYPRRSGRTQPRPLHRSRAVSAHRRFTPDRCRPANATCQSQNVAARTPSPSCVAMQDPTWMSRRRRSGRPGLKVERWVQRGEHDERRTGGTETKGVTVEVLATVDLGPEIEGMAGRELRMRMVTIEPGGVFGPIHDHKDRPGIVYIPQGTITTIETESRRTMGREWAGLRIGTPRTGSRTGNGSGGGDLGRYRQARSTRGGTRL